MILKNGDYTVFYPNLLGNLQWSRHLTFIKKAKKKACILLIE